MRSIFKQTIPLKMDSLITIDYIFILIVGFSALFGFARGFIKEMFTIANIVLAALFTYYFLPVSYDFFGKQFSSDTMVVVFSVFGVFIVTWIIIAIVNSFLIDAIGKPKGKWLDRLLGTAFGLLRGALIVISIYLGVVMGWNAQEDENLLPEWLRHAKTYNFVKMQSESFMELMPEKFQQIYKGGREGMIGKIEESVSPHGLLSDEDRKLLGYGLTSKNIGTLKKILEIMPPSFTRNLDYYDIATKLRTKTEFKDYVTNLLEDYDSALADGRIEPTIPKNQVESLKKSVNDIEEEMEDLYKGQY